MKKALDSFIKIYTEILSAFGCTFYLAFVVCVLIQIISRNLLPSAPSWTEEAARYTFIYMVAFGCGIAILRDEFVSVEFLHDALEARGLGSVNKIIKLLIYLMMLVLCIFILLQAEPKFAFIKFRMVSTAMQLPMQLIYFSQILLFGFMSLSLVLNIVRLLCFWQDRSVDMSEMDRIKNELTQEDM